MKLRLVALLFIFLVSTVSGTAAQQALPVPPPGVNLPRVTFDVNSGADAVDAVPGNGTCATASGLCTLRAAIQEANALGAAIINIWVAATTLTTGAANEDAAAGGDLDIIGAVILRGNGATLSTTVADRFFDVRPNGMLIVSDLVMIGQDTYLGLVGGCVNVGAGAVFTASRTVFNACYAATGGGVGIAGDFATVEIADSNIFGNRANTGGGLGTSGATDDARITIERTMFSLNDAVDGDGGAIYTIDSSLTLTNVTMERNTATNEEVGGRGGGLFFDSVSVTHMAALTHVTIANNTAEISGGGFYTQGIGSPLTMINSLVTDNTAPFGPDCQASATTAAQFQGSNLISTTANCPLVAAPTFTGPGLVYGAGAYRDGVFSGAIMLRPDSPARDTADPSFCLSTDEFGFPRPFGAGCDLGAFETANLTVNGGFEQACAAAPWKVSSTKDKVVVELPLTGSCALRLKGTAAKATSPTVVKQSMTPAPGILRDGDRLNLVIPTLGLSNRSVAIKAQAKYSDGTKQTIYDNLWLIAGGPSYDQLIIPFDPINLNGGARIVSKVVLKISDFTTSGTWYMDDVSVIVTRGS